MNSIKTSQSPIQIPDIHDIQISGQNVQIGNSENIIFEVLNGSLIIIETIHNNFGLILRNPSNTKNGLIITLNKNPDYLIQLTNKLLDNLGDEINFLFDYKVYDLFQNNNSLIQYLFSSSERFRSMVLSNIENNNNIDPQIVPSAPPMHAVNSLSNNEQLEQHDEEEEEHDCPICMESIINNDACMRCSGTGGIHHYFHSHCLTQWIRQCRDNGNGEPTCPICRQSLEFNRDRLSNFLDTNPSAPPAEILTQEERSYFENVLAGLAGERNGKVCLQFKKLHTLVV